MNVTTIAFLVLLGGTPSEHVITMPSYDDCQRAAETVSQFDCLNADQFDARLRNTRRIATDMQPASAPAPGETPLSKPTVDPARTETAITGMPSATQRRVRNALYPPSQPQLTPRNLRTDDAYIRADLNG